MAAGWRQPSLARSSCERRAAQCRPTCSSGPWQPGAQGLRQWPGHSALSPAVGCRAGAFQFLGLVRVRGSGSVMRRGPRTPRSWRTSAGGRQVMSSGPALPPACGAAGGWGAGAGRARRPAAAGDGAGSACVRRSDRATLRHLGRRRVLRFGRATAPGRALPRGTGLAGRPWRAKPDGAAPAGAGGRRLGQGAAWRAGLAGGLFSAVTLGWQRPPLPGTAATAAVGRQDSGWVFHSLFHSYRQSIARHSL